MNSLFSYDVRWGDDAFRLVGTPSALTQILLPNQVQEKSAWPDHPSLALWGREVEEYCAGMRVTWSIPLRFVGTTFQCSVWTALQQIPYGHTCSYGEVAEMIGRPRAIRAVAHAIGQNPLPIVVPCHRVIGANGTLTGFRGGLPLKARLLQLEGVSGLKW